MDTLLWQALASVIVPGEFVKKNCRFPCYLDLIFKSNAGSLSWVDLVVTGFTINRICWGAGMGLAKVLPGVAETARNWMVTGLGLGVIPLIIHPIDK